MQYSHMLPETLKCLEANLVATGVRVDFVIAVVGAGPGW